MCRAKAQLAFAGEHVWLLQAQLPQAQAERSKKRKARPGEAVTADAPPGDQQARQQAVAIKQVEAEGPKGVSCEAAHAPQHAPKPPAKKAKAARAKEGGSKFSGSRAQPAAQHAAERPAKIAKAEPSPISVLPASPEKAAAQHVRKRPAKKVRLAAPQPAGAVPQTAPPLPAAQPVPKRPAKKAKTAALKAAGEAPPAAPARPAAEQDAGRPAKTMKAAPVNHARPAKPLPQPAPQQPLAHAVPAPPAPLHSAGSSALADKPAGFLAALQAATRRARGDAGVLAQPATLSQAAQPDRVGAAGALCESCWRGTLCSV